jgi:hypothetical protein
VRESIERTSGLAQTLIPAAANPPRETPRATRQSRASKISSRRFILRLSVENIWDYLRSNFLSHCVWDTYEAILDACCDAWNALMEKSNVITSIGTRKWAQVTI